MKAINKIIILGMAVALFNSCDLTLLPENAVTPENYFQNKSDLELWTNQFYTLLDEPDASAGTNADDMIDKGMGQVIEGTRSAASETGWSWTKLRHINYFLFHSPASPQALNSQFETRRVCSPSVLWLKFTGTCAPVNEQLVILISPSALE